jgi:fructose-1,6-bisphosphatase/inositol monophosphatase family enzyme
MNRLAVMELAAREAGQFMHGAAELNEATLKTNVKDFFTVADIKSQDIIRKQLKEYFPEAVIVSEEDSAEEHQAMEDPDFTGFVLDPIDGTYNFKRDMRESGVSIGYVEKGKPVAGVVYDPYRDELYKATQGQGAFMNGIPIRVSGQSDLHGANVATSNGYDDEAAVRNLQRQIGIFEQAKVMPWTSCPGSGVLAMAWIANGRIDAMHHTGFKPWDNAAIFVIAGEAGAKILTLKGETASFTTKTLLIGTPAIVDQLNEIFRQLSQSLMV